MIVTDHHELSPQFHVFHFLFLLLLFIILINIVWPDILVKPLRYFEHEEVRVTILEREIIYADWPLWIAVVN